MDNKPICGEWHGNDVMPSENKLCIFEIKVGEASKGEIIIGYRQCDIIARESCELCRYYGGGDEMECDHCDPMNI